MAEAAVEDIVISRFFCHKCSIEISRVLDDYTCPTCRGGFIEELDSTATSSEEPSDEVSDDDMDDLTPLNLINQFGDILFGVNDRDLLTQGSDGVAGGRRAEDDATHGDGVVRIARYQPGDITRGLRARATQGREAGPLEHMIQDFIVNLTGVGWGPMGPGGRGNGPVFFLGNPGDYAWGREGLDAIVTQLLNQMDATGPPPLDKDKIKEIPTTAILQEQVDMNLQCSVCWEDFAVGEHVRKLECEHVYHEPCIVPWLELHGTCPICRKSLSTEAEDKPSGTGAAPSNIADLAAIIRAANSRPSSSSSSIASSSNSTSGNSTDPPGPGSQPPDFHMDFEFD